MVYALPGFIHPGNLIRKLFERLNPEFWVHNWLQTCRTRYENWIEFLNSIL
eukprot:Pgem_evm1s15244